MDESKHHGNVAQTGSNKNAKKNLDWFTPCTVLPSLLVQEYICIHINETMF